MKSIIFFDVDGTILSAGGAGRRAFSLVLKEVFRVEDDMKTVSFAGMTDRLILAQLKKKHTFDLYERDIQQCWEQMPDLLEKELKITPATLFPGVEQTLRELSEQSILSIVTGNIKKCAHAKLRSAGVLHYFKGGGFADHHEDRNEIAIQAMHSIKETNAGNSPIYLVGDTPSDVLAARHIGAAAIGVATGSYNRTELENAGAELILSGMKLEEIQHWMKAREKRG